MRISIAMATYNGEKYLSDQLDSFLYQTRQPDELVICDDGSMDGTLNILENFRSQTSFPVHIYKNDTNLGYIKNFEKAMSLCKGDIIFLSDQDDVWFCNKIATMAEVLSKKRDVFVLQADMILTDEDMNPTPYTQLSNTLAVGHPSDSFIFGCSTALRKGWLDVVLPVPELAGHDNWLHRLALVLGVRSLHKAPLQYYRRHGDNASNWLVSNPVKVTKLDSFRAHGFRDATFGWQLEWERDNACWQRISESTDALKDLRLSDRQADALLKVRRRMRALNDRMQNMRLPRYQRILRVLAMWAHGGYGYFSGWKSVAKDILRP